MKNISLKQRLIIPIVLLGLVALLSNILSIVNIRNVNASASNIADNYIEGKSRLAEICQSSMEIHKMALSHIVATDYNTMILLVAQIKEGEALLDDMLSEYENFVVQQDLAQYQSLMDNYTAFKHALVHLVCASASHKTQDAYALANGDRHCGRSHLYSSGTDRFQADFRLCRHPHQEYPEYHSGKFRAHQQYDRGSAEKNTGLPNKRCKSLLSCGTALRHLSGSGRKCIDNQ